jgi:putative AbiEii toxin of type IV toxin-antitoxin system
LPQQIDPVSNGQIVSVSEFGDGVQCFIGICLSVLSYPFRIVMIDEPEAYLHPPTAYSLGRYLSQLAIVSQSEIYDRTTNADNASASCCRLGYYTQKARSKCFVKRSKHKIFNGM